MHCRWCVVGNALHMLLCFWWPLINLVFLMAWSPCWWLTGEGSDMPRAPWSSFYIPGRPGHQEHKVYQGSSEKKEHMQCITCSALPTTHHNDQIPWKVIISRDLSESVWKQEKQRNPLLSLNSYILLVCWLISWWQKSPLLMCSVVMLWLCRQLSNRCCDSEDLPKMSNLISECWNQDLLRWNWNMFEEEEQLGGV